MAVAGAILAAVAFAWLAANSGVASELVVTGQLFKNMSAARGGVFLGALAFAVGLLVSVVGFGNRARVQEIRVQFDDEPLRDLAGQLATRGGDDLGFKFGLADGFGIFGASVLDVTRDESTVRVWDEGGGDFRFVFGEEQQAAWWRQDSKRISLPKVILALLDGAYVIRNGRVTITVGGKPVVLRESM